jgi:hypothetical protein
MDETLDDEIKNLCSDYGLPVDDNKAMNMNRFLNHIGQFLSQLCRQI